MNPRTREDIKLAVHSYLLGQNNKGATAKKLTQIINLNHLLKGTSIDTQGLANILTNAEFRGNPNRFKQDEKGYWRINV